MNNQFLGVRKAAVRRANFVLGIPELDENEMKVAARILYYADGCETFAEHELDYIIFLKPKKLTINFNKDEIK